MMGERICINISSIKVSSQEGKKFWAFIINEHSKMLWSFFLKHKSNLMLVMTPHLQEMKSKDGYDPRYLQCNNVEENKTVDTDCKKLRLGIHFKYTAPRTPQQNGLVKRTFATLYGRVRSMMNGTNIPKAEQDKK